MISFTKKMVISFLLPILNRMVSIVFGIALSDRTAPKKIRLRWNRVTVPQALKKEAITVELCRNSFQSTRAKKSG